MNTDYIQPQQDKSPAVIPAQSPVVMKEGGNVAVTALVPEEMTQCQSALIAWNQRKLEELRSDAAELRGAYEHAKERKWKSGTLLAHAVKVEKRIVFYEKMLSALEAGFVIVPNFPVSLFAIRTDRTKPLKLLKLSDYGNVEHAQPAAMLAEGEGEYKNPTPVIFRRTVPAPNDRNPQATKRETWAESYQDIEFPISMSKPEIMEATTRAMALNIFDQFGILPNAAKRDPIIVGQLIDPRLLNTWTREHRLVTFMVAWHLDTRTL